MDENIEGATEEEKSESGEAGEPSPKPEDKEPEPQVPAARLSEVVRERNELRQRVSELETKKEAGTITADEQKELQAKTYLKGLLKEVSEEAKAEEAKAQKGFEHQVNDILDENPNVDRKEFLQFIADNDEKYEFASPKAAFRIFQDLKKTSEESKEKGKKEVLGKPNLPPSQGGGSRGSGLEYSPNKSFAQLAEEAKAKLE
ncbi:MAG: hypothetical protein FJ045_05605 [Crenarchaeota archaeon]|nr:hypothetical protein [Thermoproteota archaeon]